MELEELPSVETLVCLERLVARKCVNLKRIQGLAQPTELQLLDVRECSELKELPCLEHVNRLDTVYASGCPKLQWGGGVVEELHQLLEEGFIIALHAGNRGQLAHSGRELCHDLFSFLVYVNIVQK